MERCFITLELVRGNHKVAWEYIGEGWNGDYDPTNPDDAKLLRFYCYALNLDSGEWEEMQNASYCTLMTTGTSTTKLAIVAVKILETIEEGEDYKHRLEDLSWIDPNDIKC